MIFETHAHYDDEVFNEDREQLLAGLPEKGIGRVINVGASIETTRTTMPPWVCIRAILTG